MRLLRHIASFALLCMLWACGGGDRALQSALDRADALMETHPDSARALLEPYDGAEIRSEAQRARFALLYTISLYKNDVEAKSDSLIASANTYYNEHGPARSAMLASYYSGCLLMEGRRFEKAAVLALESLEKAEQLRDTLFMARSCDLLGLIEYENYLMEEARPHFLRAATLFKAAGKNKNELVALSTAGQALDWLGRRKQSIQLLDSLREQAWAIEDTTFAMELTSKMIPILLKNGNPEPEITDKEVATLKGYDYLYSDNPHTLSALALHRLYKGDLQGSDSLLRLARGALSVESEKASILSVEVERAKRAGAFQLAGSLTDSILKLQSSVVRELFKREVTTAERNYMAERGIRAEVEKRKTRTALWLSLGVFLIFGIVATIAVRIIIRKRNEKIGRQIDEIRLLSDTLRRYQTRNSALEGSLPLTHYKALDSLCDQYFQGSESQLDRNLLRERLDAVMEELRGEESMAAVRGFANRNFNFILDRAKEALPKIKESDLTFIALVKVGFSARSVCLLLDMKPSSFYSKRDRLEKRLKNSGIIL